VRLLFVHHDTKIYITTQSILHFTILVAGVSMIEILLEDRRIDINLLHGNQKTVFHMAASNDRMNAVQLLLAHRDAKIERLGEGLAGWDLTLPTFPEVARYFTMVQMAGRRGMVPGGEKQTRSDRKKGESGDVRSSDLLLHLLEASKSIV